MTKFLIMYSLFIIQLVNAQKVDVNFILEINEDVNLNLSNVKLNTYSADGTRNEYELIYIPGKLQIDKQVYQTILSQNLDNVTLSFTDNRLCKEKIDYKKYVIQDFEIDWMKSNFFILHIYDMSKKKYRKMFHSKSNSNFLIEYHSSEESSLLTRKRN